MTYDRIAASPRRPETILKSLVAEYGALKVMAALMAAILKSNRAPPRARISDLSEHLRRDIGLGPDFRRGPRHEPMPGPRW